MTGKKLLIFIMTALFSTQAFAATIVIQNNDGVDEGFNDPLAPTNANQIGNNPGTTLGDMRLNVFQAAADVWGEILNSNITITVGGSFEEKFCSANSATLGSAGANGSVANLPGLDPDIAYPIALGESLNDSNINGTLVEINASFNSLVDSDPACLDGGGFYYGLDDNAPPGTSPLFSLVLHEIAHGLGFASMADVGSGGSGGFNGAGQFPDTYSRRLLDLDNGKSWDEMSNAERLASALNEPELVWEGAQVTADRDKYLGFAPELIINAPGEIAGTFEAVLGEEPNAVIPPGGVTAGIINGDTFGNSCSQIFEASFSGKIILFDKSESCGAVVPAFFSEIQGAVGVIIAATTATGLPDVSGLIDNQDVNIPYIGVEKSIADDLRANLATANVSLDTSNSTFNGENDGKLKMFAPAVFESGSSVSHWSKTASPNLLMEPVLSDLDFADVDLTAAAFKDIGWSVNATSTWDLSVTKSGTGTGTVTSSPAGINCGGDCSDTYNDGTRVDLSASAAAGSEFVSWSGACSGSVSPVSVTMDADKSCDAGFSVNTNTYTIGGTVSGLATDNEVVLQNNSGDNLTVNDNGLFTFATALDDGSSYAVTVLTQPTSPSQTCNVTGGSGSVAGADVTNVSVICVTGSENIFTDSFE